MNIRTTVNRIFHDDNGKSASVREAPDALSLLHADHEEVAALFETALDDGTPAAQRRAAITRILDALALHAKIEESIFYPALRKAGKTPEKDSVLEAAEEHGVVKDLIAKIKRSAGRDETLKAKLTVLKELVQHHVREEESTMFDEARRVLGSKLQALGTEMQRMKDRAMKPAGRRKAAPARATRTRKTPTRKKTAGRR